MSLMYAKESIVLSTLQDIAEDQKVLQEVNLQGSGVWKAKSAAMTEKLVTNLATNTRLTSLNMTDCNLNDACLTLLNGCLATNATLFHLNLSYNKVACCPALLVHSSSAFGALSRDCWPRPLRCRRLHLWPRAPRVNVVVPLSARRPRVLAGRSSGGRRWCPSGTR